VGLQEHAVQAVAPGRAGLRAFVQVVVGEVLDYGFVGIGADLAEAEAVGVFLGQGKQPGTDPAALGAGSTATFVRQQIAG
jgi:hypothetical protein